MKKLLLALSMFTFVFVLTACEGETVEEKKTCRRTNF